MSSLPCSLLRFPFSQLLAIALALSASACCTMSGNCCRTSDDCCPATSSVSSGGEVVSPPDAVPNPQRLDPTGAGSNPRVSGRARFQGSLVRFDLQLLESSPAQADNIKVWWTSHLDSTAAMYQLDPQATFPFDPPKTRQFVFNIPATWNSTSPNDCFHVLVEVLEGTTSLGRRHQKFTPVLDTEWGAEWATAP